MTSYKAQQDSEARPPALQVKAKGAPSAVVARMDTMKAIGDGGN
jgi:hypothetical protein